MMMLGLGGLLFVPVLLTFAALMAAFPGGVFRVAGSTLIGSAFFGVLILGFSAGRAPARPLAGPRVRIMRKAPARAIDVRPQAPAKAK